jgi:DNA-binding NarL/FixJ family response regulator
MASAVLTQGRGSARTARGRSRAARRGPEQIRHVVLADQEALYRVGLREALGELFRHARVDEAASFEGLLKALAQAPAEVVLLDGALPGLAGYLSLLVLAQRFPDTCFIAVSAIDDAVVARRALACGLSGFASKRASRERIAQAVASALRRPRPARALPPAERRLIEGLRALTPAELTLFALLPDNPSHRHLMQALGIALPTVKTHMSRILQKLALRNRTEAAVVANRLSSLNTAPLCLDARGGPATGP